MTNLYFSFLNFLILFQIKFLKKVNGLNLIYFFYVGLTCVLILARSIYMVLSTRKYSFFSVNTLMHLSEYLCYNHLRTKQLR